jgi:hypothetical protein
MLAATGTEWSPEHGAILSAEEGHRPGDGS